MKTKKAAQPPASNALDYLSKQQQTDGSFAIICNSQKHRPSVAVQLIVHAFLLDFLCASEAANSEVVVGVARYLKRILKLPQLTQQLQTVDTCAMFHAIAALHQYDSSLLSADAIATCIRFLVNNELEIGGPYRNITKSVTSPDVTTNVTICRFIHTVGGPFPKLLSYIEQASTTHNTSQYFATSWPFEALIQSMDRAVTGDRHIIATPITATISFFDNEQDSPIDFFCKDPRDPEAKYGSAAVKAARVLATTNAISLASKRSIKRQGLHPDYKLVVRQARQISNTFSPYIKRHLNMMVDRIVKADQKQEIGLLAVRFAPSMITEKRYSHETLRTLGVANLYNWAAYTIYDDFLDDEGQPRLLPTANTALRVSTALWHQAMPDISFENIVTATFNAVDAANIWEITHCRGKIQKQTITISVLPKYGDLHNLYQRSLTHSLPLLGTFASLGMAVDDPDVVATLTAFKKYLIIRQLNDDLHDWEEDIQAGHISYVVARTLADANIMQGQWSLAQLVPIMERAFLRRTLPNIGSEIIQLAAQAHEYLFNTTIVSSPNVVDALINDVEQNTSRLLSEHAQAMSFLKTYQAISS